MYVFILQHFHCLWQNLSSLLPPIHSTTLWFLNRQQMQQDDSVNKFSIHCNNEKILSWFHNVDNNINNLADQRMVLVISIRLNNLKKTTLWFRSQLCRLQLSENWVVRVASRSQRTKSISKCRNVHCDWFIQGLQILLMSGVSVTSASQILESFWNIWSQVSDFPAHGPGMYTPLWGICEVAVAARWPGKLKSMIAVIE